MLDRVLIAMGRIVLRVSSSGCRITLNNEAGLHLEIKRRTELKSSEKIEQLIWRNDAFTGPTIVTSDCLLLGGSTNRGYRCMVRSSLGNVVMCATSCGELGETTNLIWCHLGE